jgi:hypothetical protein
LGIPIWSFLHFHMIAAVEVHGDAGHCGRNTAIPESTPWYSAWPPVSCTDTLVPVEMSLQITKTSGIMG